MEVDSMGIFDGLNQLRRVNSVNNTREKTRYYDILNIYNNSIVHLDKDTGEKQVLDKVTVVIFNIDKPLYVTRVINTYPRIVNHEIIIDELTDGSGVSGLMSRDTFRKHYSIKKRYFSVIPKQNWKRFNKIVRFEWYMVLPVIVVKKGVDRPTLMIVRNQNVIKGFTSLDLDDSKYNLTIGGKFDINKPTLLLTIDMNDPRNLHNLQYTYTPKYNEFLLSIYNTIVSNPIEVYQQSYDDFINYAKNRTRDNKDEILVQVEYYINELTNMMEYELQKYEQSMTLQKDETNETNDDLDLDTIITTKRKQSKSVKLGNNITDEKRTSSDEEFDKLLESLNIDVSDDDDEDEIPF